MPGGIDALARLNVTFYVAGQNCQQSYWIRAKPTDPLANLFVWCDKICDDWRTNIWPRYAQLQPGTVQLIGSVCTVLNPRLTAQSVRAYTTDFGLAVGECLPPHDAAVLSLYTRFAGRRVHGRLYIPGISESLQDSGTLTAAGKTALKNLGDTIIGQYGDVTGASPNYWGGVYSRANGATRNPGPPPFIDYSPLTHVPWIRHVPNERLGTNRHRKIGRGV
jgi:hypothetical protein